MNNKVLPLSVVAWVALTSPQSHGQSNFHSAPLAGRSSLMGGTGVALGVDGAAPFLNPANLAHIGDRSLAFSSRLFRYAKQDLGQLHQPADPSGAFAGAEVDETSESAVDLGTLPDTTCYFFGPGGGQPSGATRVGLCLGKTEELDLTLHAINARFNTAAGVLHQTRALGIDWSNRSFGPSVGFPIAPGLSLGFGISGLRARLKAHSQVSSLLDSGGSQTITSGNYTIYGQSWDVAAQVGATYRATPHWTFGLSVRGPALHLHDSYESGFGSASSLGVGQLDQAEGTFVVRPPIRVNTGLGFEHGWFRTELDLFWHAPRDGYVTVDSTTSRTSTGAGESSLASSRSEDTPMVLNVALGAEAFIEPDLSVLFGFGTDLAAGEAITAESARTRVFHSKMDYLRASVGLSSYTQYGDLVFGLRFDRGTGQLAVLSGTSDVAAWGVTDWTEHSVVLVFAGRVDLRTISKTADGIADAVDGGEKVAKPKKPQQPLQEPAKVDK